MWKRLLVSLFVGAFLLPAVAAEPETTAPPKQVLRPTAEEWCGEGVKPTPGNDCVTPPVLISAVPASYPEIALKGRISGQVDLEIVVDEKGNVRDVKVVRPNRVFNEAAVAAVKERRYKPATRGGEPVATAFLVFVRFDLDAPAGNPLASQRTGAGEVFAVSPYDTKATSGPPPTQTVPRDTSGTKK